MKRRIRLTESDLHKIVKESVQMILKESEIGDLYNRIDEMFMSGGSEVKVSRFYSDENQITLAVPVSEYRQNGMKKFIVEKMKGFGYEYYTAGGNDGYIMMSFERMS
jgi:hypothetical protein